MQYDEAGVADARRAGTHPGSGELSSDVHEVVSKSLVVQRFQKRLRHRLVTPLLASGRSGPARPLMEPARPCFRRNYPAQAAGGGDFGVPPAMKQVRRVLPHGHFPFRSVNSPRPGRKSLSQSIEFRSLHQHR